jgi:hypothetical protein
MINYKIIAITLNDALKKIQELEAEIFGSLK